MMKTMGRDDVDRGPRGRGRGCCGGPGCCGGHGRGPRFEREGESGRAREEEMTSRRRLLEERRRDLEELLAEVTSELSDLGAENH